MATACTGRAYVVCLVLGLLPAASAWPEDAPQPDPKPEPRAAEEKKAEEPDPPPPDIFAAAKSGNLEAVKKFLEATPALLNARTKVQDTPLHWAASCGHVAVVRFLLGKNADVDAKNLTGSTPLHLACRMSYKAIVELLVAAKANVNAKRDGEEEENETPLHIAAQRGDTEIAELLLKNKADVNAKLTTDQTPLDLAKKARRKEMIRLLKKHGASDDEEE